MPGPDTVGIRRVPCVSCGASTVTANAGNAKHVCSRCHARHHAEARRRHREAEAAARIGRTVA